MNPQAGFTLHEDWEEKPIRPRDDQSLRFHVSRLAAFHICYRKNKLSWKGCLEVTCFNPLSTEQPFCITLPVQTSSAQVFTCLQYATSAYNLDKLAVILTWSTWEKHSSTSSQQVAESSSHVSAQSLFPSTLSLLSPGAPAPAALVVLGQPHSDPSAPFLSWMSLDVARGNWKGQITSAHPARNAIALHHRKISALTQAQLFCQDTKIHFYKAAS